MKKTLRLREKVEEVLNFITTDYEEEAAAEALLQDRNSLEDIREDVSEGTPLTLAVRQALQRMVEKRQADRENTLEYDYDSYDDNEYNVHSRYGAYYMLKF